MKNRLKILFLIITLLILSSCDFGTNTAKLCSDYCSKLITCGTLEEKNRSECEDNCKTLILSGSDTTYYECVADSSCDDISSCGI